MNSIRTLLNNPIYRKDCIIELCTEKKVLHLGFVQHKDLWKEKMQNDDWLHSKIANTAKKLVGIDYLKNEVELIRKKFDYDVYFGNVMKLNKVDISKKFDVIVCGELIEHISNPGLMLDGIKRFMHLNTILIITTPNPWRDLWVKNMYTNNLEINWINPEHVCWYSFQTLKQLLFRYNYKEVHFDYYLHETKEYHDNIESERNENKFKSYLKKILGIDDIKTNKVFNSEGLFFVSKL